MSADAVAPMLSNETAKQFAQPGWRSGPIKQGKFEIILMDLQEYSSWRLNPVVSAVDDFTNL